MNSFVFSCQTIPDTAAGRRLYGDPTAMQSLTEAEVAKVMYLAQAQRQPDAPLVLGPHLHKVIALAGVLRSETGCQFISLCGADISEVEILRHFFGLLRHFSPVLVSWDAACTALPVLMQRGLLHAIPMPEWFQAEPTPSQHLALARLFSGSLPASPLPELAALLGAPLTLVLDAETSWEAWQAGNYAALRQDNEAQALRTAFIYLRFCFSRGLLSVSEYETERHLLRSCLPGADYAAWRHGLAERLTP